MKRYGVLTGDVIGSTGIKNWRTVSAGITNLLGTLNDELADPIVMRFHVTVGDEFQGALKDPVSLFHAFRQLRLRMPVAFRCGMGVGSIEGLAGDAASMRGEAFYRARRAIEVADSSGRRSYLIASRNTTPKDMAINAILAFMDDIESHWTERQLVMARYYLLNDGLSYQDVAERFDVTPQSVSQTLKAARISLIKGGEESILQLLGGGLRTPIPKANMLDS